MIKLNYIYTNPTVHLLNNIIISTIQLISVNNVYCSNSDFMVPINKQANRLISTF